jgi:hypothetical protein
MSSECLLGCGQLRFLHSSEQWQAWNHPSNCRSAHLPYGVLHWNIVAGTQQPYSQELRSTNLVASQSSFDAQTIELNKMPPTSLFDRPRDPVYLDFPQASDWSGWITFDFVDGKRIFIPAEVNSRRAMLLLDGGAETTVLGKQVAQGAGVDCSGQIGVEGAGGSDAAALCTGVSIRLGRQPYRMSQQLGWTSKLSDEMWAWRLPPFWDRGFSTVRLQTSTSKQSVLRSALPLTFRFLGRLAVSLLSRGRETAFSRFRSRAGHQLPCSSTWATVLP